MKPFETIESAQEFVDLLIEEIEEARNDVDTEIRLYSEAGDERRLQALQLVAMNLRKLGVQSAKCRRILNDLRMLRRLLLEEAKRSAQPEEAARRAGAA